MTETIVVGGGIVGASVAYHLARFGIETVIIDRDDGGRATNAAAGVVSPATSSQNADPVWYDLALSAFEYYEDLIAALESDQDGPTGYSHRGLLAVAIDEDELDEFERMRHRTNDRASKSDTSYLAPGSFHVLEPEIARRRFPPLAQPLGVLAFDDAARVDGGTLSEALIRAGSKYGLKRRTGGVERLVTADGTFAAVVTSDGDRLDAESVVVAGGAWSTQFAEPLGFSIPVEPVRGQVVRVTPDDDLEDWPIIVSFRDKVMAPWPDGRMAIGATREPDVGFTSHSTVNGVHEVLGEILRVAPGLNDAQLTDIRSGLRPVSTDGLPLIGPVPGVGGAFLVTGHGATGITHGPYTGKLTAELVVGREPSTDLDPFVPHRFE